MIMMHGPKVHNIRLTAFNAIITIPDMYLLDRKYSAPSSSLHQEDARDKPRVHR